MIWKVEAKVYILSEQKEMSFIPIKYLLSVCLQMLLFIRNGQNVYFMPQNEFHWINEVFFNNMHLHLPEIQGSEMEFKKKKSVDSLQSQALFLLSYH